MNKYTYIIKKEPVFSSLQQEGDGDRWQHWAAFKLLFHES